MLEGALTYIIGLASNALFWIILIIVGMSAILIGLKVKQKMRRKFFVWKIVELGNGKVSIVETKAGYFQKNRKIFGLIEWNGELELVTSDNEIIYGFLPEDFQFKDNERLIMVTPNPDNPAELFPLRKIMLSDKTKSVLMEIAPIEVREAAVDAYNKTTNEMKDMNEKIVQWFLIGLFFIVAFLVILVITQYGKHMVDKSTDTLAQIGDKLVDASNNANTIKGASP